MVVGSSFCFGRGGIAFGGCAFALHFSLGPFGIIGLGGSAREFLLRRGLVFLRKLRRELLLRREFRRELRRVPRRELVFRREFVLRLVLRLVLRRKRLLRLVLRLVLGLARRLRGRRRVPMQLLSSCRISVGIRYAHIRNDSTINNGVASLAESS